MLKLMLPVLILKLIIPMFILLLWVFILVLILMLPILKLKEFELMESILKVLLLLIISWVYLILKV